MAVKGEAAILVEELISIERIAATEFKREVTAFETTGAKAVAETGAKHPTAETGDIWDVTTRVACIHC